MSYLNEDIYLGMDNDRINPVIIAVGDYDTVDGILKNELSYRQKTSIVRSTDIFDGNDLENDVYTLHGRTLLMADNICVTNNGNSEYTVQIDVSGDWKHDHLWFKNLMSKLFHATQVSENLIGESDSDYYAATHTYRILV
jgi:hypothetical protein